MQMQATMSTCSRGKPVKLCGLAKGVRLCRFCCQAGKSWLDGLRHVDHP